MPYADGYAHVLDDHVLDERLNSSSGADEPPHHRQDVSRQYRVREYVSHYLHFYCFEPQLKSSCYSNSKRYYVDVLLYGCVSAYAPPYQTMTLINIDKSILWSLLRVK